MRIEIPYRQLSRGQTVSLESDVYSVHHVGP